MKGKLNIPYAGDIVHPKLETHSKQPIHISYSYLEKTTNYIYFAVVLTLHPANLKNVPYVSISLFHYMVSTDPE